MYCVRMRGHECLEHTGSNLPSPVTAKGSYMDSCIQRAVRAPNTDEVRIAARGQHIARWTSPRSSYPEVRSCAGRLHVLSPAPACCLWCAAVPI